jgi:hypothetical protein
MPRTFEIPDDLGTFLDDWAPKLQKTDAQTLLVFLIEQFRKEKQPAPAPHSSKLGRNK